MIRLLTCGYRVDAKFGEENDVILELGEPIVGDWVLSAERSRQLIYDTFQQTLPEI